MADKLIQALDKLFIYCKENGIEFFINESDDASSYDLLNCDISQLSVYTDRYGDDYIQLNYDNKYPVNIISNLPETAEEIPQVILDSLNFFKPMHKELEKLLSNE